jgi:uncharacterized protein (DUF849 family)
MGVPWGAPDDMNTFMAMVNNVPRNWLHSAFSIGKNQMAFVAAAVLSGGNVRVGLETTLGSSVAAWRPMPNWLKKHLGLFQPWAYRS